MGFELEREVLGMSGTVVAEAPTSSEALALRHQLPSDVWTDRVKDAVRRAHCLETVRRERKETGGSWRKCLKQVAPDVSWSRYQSWRRRARARSGPLWERLLDYRNPPPREPIRAVAMILRRAEPGMDCETARGHFTTTYGESGAISDTSLRRIWRAAGLTNLIRKPPSTERVERFHGGGGLALVAAAAEETGAPMAMAESVLELEAHVENIDAKSPLSAPEHRDAWGRFTPEYNQSVHANTAPGKLDPRQRSDATKRAQRNLATLSTLHLRPETLAHKLLCMGATPLLTERRGFDGLAGPQGGWLGVLGGTAYKPATLDKTLAELALAGVNQALWAAHGQHWAVVSREWCKGGPPWLQLLVYVDGSQEPYWTRLYAASAKESRVGKVMPALSRVAVMAGPGVPLLMVPVAGAASLKSMLVPNLKGLEEVVGEGELGRIVVVDAEVATSLSAILGLCSLENRYFITVLKGALAKQAYSEAKEWTDWKAYRARDKIREAEVVLQGLTLQLVEMRREGRQSKSTLFATTAPRDLVAPADVPTAYLSRWPHQEQVFRNGRNGGGLNRTHGYGGEYVANVAIETEQEKAERSVRRAEKKLKDNDVALTQAKSLKEVIHANLKASRKEVTAAKKAHAKAVSQAGDSEPVSKEQAEERLSNATAAKEAREEQLNAARRAITSAAREAKNAEKALKRAEAAMDKTKTTSRVVYRRDPTREDIGTAVTAMVLMLVQMVLMEYFPAGTRMEWRTFIELFVYLPVTVRTSSRRILYEIEANPRAPDRMDQLRHACDEINRRKIHRGSRLLEFSLVEPGAARSG